MLFSSVLTSLQCSVVTILTLKDIFFLIENKLCFQPSKMLEKYFASQKNSLFSNNNNTQFFLHKLHKFFTPSHTEKKINKIPFLFFLFKNLIYFLNNIFQHTKNPPCLPILGIHNSTRALQSSPILKRNILLIAKCRPENITLVVKCVKLLFHKILRK